jgi:acetyltransferase-like isoleucine patch superfamily enzyme
LDADKIILAVGRNCYIQKQVGIWTGNKVSIGNNVLIGRNVLIEDSTHQYVNVHKSIREQGFVNNKKGGSVIIEDDCWIGQGAAIFAKGYEIKIGKHSVIGANTVVRKSIPPYSVVFGVPAKIIKKYDFKKKKWVKFAKNNKNI